MFFTYILKCADGSYYAGHTDDLEQRLSEHQSGKISGYTAIRLPVEIVWAKSFPLREAAIFAEVKIKGWSRKKKEALIREDWQEIRGLSKNRQVL
jgi:predicted GIY-YIG superfamily endonuclease